jgi:hypothetical protein
MQYLIVFGGGLLGMLLTVLVQAEIINRSDKFPQGFNDALKFYTTKKRGALYVGFTTLLILLFVLPELLQGELPFLKNFAEKIRLWSVFFGIISQALGFYLVKSSHKELKNFEQKPQP